jgi:hypothetical protein
MKYGICNKCGGIFPADCSVPFAVPCMTPKCTGYVRQADILAIYSNLLTARQQLATAHAEIAAISMVLNPPRN